LTAGEILSRLRPDLEAAGLWADASRHDNRARVERAIDLVKPRARKLADLVPQLRPFLTEQVDRDPAAVAKHLAGPDLPPHLDAWRQRLAQVEPFDAATLESVLREVAEERGVKPGVLIHATRVAVTGQAVSPGLFEVLEVVGRDRVLSRLREVVGPT
jgi:glutamyl/glutaminyl-tRNA synthetase